jgi:hypothetical protein
MFQGGLSAVILGVQISLQKKLCVEKRKNAVAVYQLLFKAALYLIKPPFSIELNKKCLKNVKAPTFKERLHPEIHGKLSYRSVSYWF